MLDINPLRQKLAEVKAGEPKLRNRDLAQRLGISEATLLTLDPGDRVVRLEGRTEEGGAGWKELLTAVKDMGYVMALTRNEHAVHERKGIYDNLTFYKGAHNVGVAVNPDIDLRFFMNEWAHGLAVTMPRGEHGTLYSFQFFNKRGEAVHKIFSTPKSDLAAYHRLVEQFRAEDQSPLLEIDSKLPEREPAKPDSEIDVAGFQTAWRELQDTHDFYGILRKFGVTRTQGLRLAPEGFTQQVDNETVVRTLELAAEGSVSIMCFLHSPGTVQIHTGEVKNLRWMGDWYNVLDPKFNLHLKMSAVKETWVVRKPTEDGIVTSVELFDEQGELIVYFFGERKPGKPELETWREVVAAATATDKELA